MNLFLDSLTGLSSVAAFIQCDAGRTFGDHGTMVFLDMVKLKAMNDMHGHSAGDAYIRHVADLIRSEMLQVFPQSSAYREGGPSFLVVLKGVQEEAAQAAVARINQVLQEDTTFYPDREKGVLTSTLRYEEAITSPLAMLRQGYRALYTTLGDSRKAMSQEDMIHVVDNLYFRINMAMRLLDHHTLLAYKDDVSGLPNSRAAEQALEYAQGAFDEEKQPFCILFIDGDNLRRYNKLGYEHGNRMIAGISRIMKEQLREQDQIFRWLSGDEFVVLLHGTEVAEAMAVAEKIREAVEEGTRSWHFPVTVSIGLACCPADGVVAKDIVDLAELANKQAKEDGKNRVRH